MLCCFAMVFGTSYDMMEKWLGDYAKIWREKGCGADEEFAALESLGYFKNIHFYNIIMSPHFGTVEFVKKVLRGRRAIITVRSKNTPGSYHAVYWSGEELFDPCNDTTYTWKEVEPIEVLLFNEAHTPRLITLFQQA
jgi:hypothetical protein